PRTNAEISAEIRGQARASQVSIFGGLGRDAPFETTGIRRLVFRLQGLLCHAWSHGKQRQRQKGSQESAQTEAKTGSRPQTGGFPASPAEVRQQKAAHTS